MKTTNIMKAVCAMGLTAACAWSLAGCAGGQQESQQQWNLTGGVAATVNGTEILEDTITNYIESSRISMEKADEDSWGQWLAENSYTPESLREEIINSFAQRELIEMGAEERGITVDSAEVDSYVTAMKERYDNDDAKWQEALSQAGMTEDEYRSEIELQLKNRALQESFASDEESSEEEMLQYAKMYAQAYDGAKKSSHILFNAEDEATANEVLARLKSGELDFAEAAKEYSQDTGSAENGGDVGWDKMNSFVEEYTTALEGLQKDQMSELVASQYGFHIIKCTDVYEAPKTVGEDGTETVEITSMDQIPADWHDTIKDTLGSQKEGEAYQAWLEEYQANADIVINPMPQGLPYAVDMSKYETAESTDTTEGSTEATDAAAAAAGDQEATDSTSTSTEGTANEATDADAAAAAASSGDSASQSSQQPAEAA